MAALPLLACAELSATIKVNIEMPFSSPPSIPRLIEELNAMLSWELHAHTGSNRGFEVESMTIYDDSLMQWVDLQAPQQLHPYDQLYVFGRGIPPSVNDGNDNGLPPPRASKYYQGQATIPVHRQAPQPPRGQREESPVVTIASTGAVYRGSIEQSTQRRDSYNPYSVPAGGASNITHQGHSNSYVVGERRSNSRDPQAFDRRDGRSSSGGHENFYSNGAPQQQPPRDSPPVFVAGPSASNIASEDIRNAYQKGGEGQEMSRNSFAGLLASVNLQFSEEVVRDMFDLATNTTDRNQPHARMGLAEFSEWARTYPRTFNTLSQRLKGREIEQARKQDLGNAHAELSEIDAKRARLQDELRSLELKAKEVNERAAHIERSLIEMENGRYNLQQEEQQVLNKEVHLAQQRLLLRREEQDFEAAARQLDTKRTSSVSSSTRY